MKFRLVHPSRQRAARAAAAIEEWRAASSGLHVIEHVLSVDDDDPELPSYRDLAARYESRLVVGRNRTMVEAVNRGAAAATGDALVAIADDFGCPPHWDASLVAVIDRPVAAVFVHDGLDGRIMTLPILTRGCYERLGHIYHPSYISMYADDDLTEATSRMGAVIDVRDRLLFPHRHASVTGQSDATHARQNSSRSFWHGWRTFQRRRIDVFGERPTAGRRALARLGIDAYYSVRVCGSRLRQAWLPHLPPALVRAEWQLRTATLRAAARLTRAPAGD